MVQNSWQTIDMLQKIEKNKRFLAEKICFCSVVCVEANFSCFMLGFFFDIYSLGLVFVSKPKCLGLSSSEDTKQRQANCDKTGTSLLV